MPLRPYQQETHDTAISWIRKTISPGLIDAATGAGKSHIIAAVAETINTMSKGKHVLCLAPSSELVKQNREKFLTTGKPASVFSSSAGSKCLKHPVVFGTPGTVKNSITRFGSRFALIIIDECHGITPTVKNIIERIREVNPNVRVLGLTATPYRLGEGYIYSMDENDKPLGESCCRDPYFTKCIYKIHARELIKQGHLTPPRVCEISAGSYDVSKLIPNSKHKKTDIDAAFVGHGRKTSAIVADVVNRSKYKFGVMFFAATVQHAEEIMASLPANAECVTGKTKRKERERIVSDFKAQRFKYLVNVGVFTTGFDATHVDGVAILRATESVGLLQQIIGRGLRLHEGKEFCDVWDYASNIENHCPDGDIFKPEVRVTYKGEWNGTIDAECELCGTINKFSARKNSEGFEYDKQGYFVDLDGCRINSDFGDIPGHHGRRCQGKFKAGSEYEQCSYRWTSKECPNCSAHNDIAARYCCDCKGEIINPNDKLLSLIHI